MVPRQGTRLLVLVLATATLSLILLKVLSWPIVFILAVNGACAFSAIFLTRRESVRVALLTFATACWAGAAVELWAMKQWSAKPVKHFSVDFQEPDSLLGWKLAAGRVGKARLTLSGRTIYDVTYSMDAQGFRQTVQPQSADTSVRGCVLLFVDSFTFGEGLADEAALPQRVALYARNRFRIVNFAVPAYGAEHMLAELEFGVVRRRSPCTPTHVIYQALPQHVLRAAGHTEYSRWGPRYQLTSDKTVRYAGTPKRAHGRRHESWTALHEQLSKSALFRLAAERVRGRGSPDDLQLYIGILKQVRQVLAHEYPGAQLHVIAWSVHSGLTGGFEPFRAGLAEVTPNLHLVDDILPGYRGAPVQYQLDASDAHPNARAIDLLAAYVAQHILGVPTERGSLAVRVSDRPNVSASVPRSANQ